MNKRLFTLIALCLLASLCLFTLIACSDGTGEPTNAPTDAPTNAPTDAPIDDPIAIPAFDTQNIKSITFYGYYGNGSGSKVPSENMEEIIAWLGTFTIDRRVEDGELIAPGSNTYHVEIEYLDGTVVETGLDVMVIDDVAYLLNRALRPDCLWDIMKKSVLE